MATAPVVTELPLQNVRFLFGTMVDLRMLPQVLEQTGNAEVGEFKLVAHFPADEKAANNEAGYLARHKGFRGGDYNTYHGDPYTLDEVIWDATGRAGVHLVTKTKYGAVVEFPTIPDKNDSAELMLIVSEYVESIKTPPLIVRCSGFGGSISPLGNKKYQLNLTTGATKCPTSIKDHVPKKYHAEDNEIIPHVGGAYIMNAEDLSPAEQSLISNTIVNQMQGYYRTGVIGTDPVIGAFPNGPMSISKRTPEAKQDFFREPAVQDEDGFWNKGPNRWQAHKIARGVAYNRLEKAREMGALTPGYRHRGSSGKFRRNPFMLGSESSKIIPHGLQKPRPESVPAEIIEVDWKLRNTDTYGGHKYSWYEGKIKVVLPPGECVDGDSYQQDSSSKIYSQGIHQNIGVMYTEVEMMEPDDDWDELDAEDFAAERKLMCAEHDDYFNACGCGSKNAEEVSGDIVFTARQFVDKLHDVDGRMYEDVLDTIAWQGYGRVGTWSDDDLGNMILHEDEDESMSAENRQPPWSATNPRPNRRIECGVCDARGFIAGKECTKCDGAGYWNIHSPRCATCDTDIQWTDGAECDECESWYCDNHLTEDGGCKVCGNTSLSFHSEDIPVWNDGIVEWETSGPMSPTGSGYSSASVPPTGVIAGPGDTFLNYTDAQNYLVESSGGLWGAEDEEGNTPVMPPHEFGQPVHWQPYDERITALKRQRAEGGMALAMTDEEVIEIITEVQNSDWGVYEKYPVEKVRMAMSLVNSKPSLKAWLQETFGSEEFAAMARIDPKNATDVKNVVSALKKRYNKIKISRTEYITNRVGSSNKYHVFAFTNRGVFNAYGRIGKTMTIFGPMSESQGHSKLDRKLRQGYKETV